MSETSSNFDFSVLKDAGLDVSEIFGTGAAGGNPFAAAPQQAVPVAAAPQPTAQAETVLPVQAAQPTQAATPMQESSTAETASPNPIAAAFAAQEEAAAQAQAKSLFEKPAVFSYGGTTQAIEDGSQTFEELRIEMSEDFPELSEGKKVSWSVEYGKVTKAIADPRGTTIASVKSEIERSKEFLDGLKKLKTPNPDCLLKPKVTAQSKGIATYKGVFDSLEEAKDSDKTICILPAQDGQIYELRKTEMGDFIAPKSNVVEFGAVRAGFSPALPLIPKALMEQLITFFRSFMNEDGTFEALAHIYWDRAAKEFTVHIPKQEVSKAYISADLSGEALPESRYLHYADIHSHNDMEAKFSSVDDADERATRLYLVIGRLNQFYPTIAARFSCGGVYQSIDPATVLEGMDALFPNEWLRNVTRQGNEEAWRQFRPIIMHTMPKD